MRLCPTVDGTASPLITHRISVDVCFARQGANYHKCHRCQYRGKSADWEPEPQTAMINVHAAEEVIQAEVEPVALPRRVPAKTPPAAANKAAAKPKTVRKPAVEREAAG
jgi:hypothetical protein